MLVLRVSLKTAKRHALRLALKKLFGAFGTHAEKSPYKKG
jgi:hypothetical protein